MNPIEWHFEKKRAERAVQKISILFTLVLLGVIGLLVISNCGLQRRVERLELRR